MEGVAAGEGEDAGSDGGAVADSPEYHHLKRVNSGRAEILLISTETFARIPYAEAIPEQGSRALSRYRQLNTSAASSYGN